MTILFATLFYAAFAVLACGVVGRLVCYLRVPLPLNIPLTPAPTSRHGALMRVVHEAVGFVSLFKADRRLWACAMLFHLGLGLVLVRHLRFFTPWPLEDMAPMGLAAAAAMMAGLALLLMRRMVVTRVKLISAPSDYLLLVLLLNVGGTGMAMAALGETDETAVTAFFRGLMSLNPPPLPMDPLLAVHLVLVVLLMMVFPFSKLLHAPGQFLCPTRTRPDSPQGRR